MQSFIDALQRFGIGRLAAILGVAAGVAAALFALVLNVGAEPKALLYSNLDLKEAGSITQSLDLRHLETEMMNLRHHSAPALRWSWRLALLGVARGEAAHDEPGAHWLEPPSPSPVFVRLGSSAEPGCQAVGFPQSEVQGTPEGRTVRQSEQLRGTLEPLGQAKQPVNAERRLPKRWIPFDTDVLAPENDAYLTQEIQLRHAGSESLFAW